MKKILSFLSKDNIKKHSRRRMSLCACKTAAEVDHSHRLISQVDKSTFYVDISKLTLHYNYFTQTKLNFKKSKAVAMAKVKIRK